MWPAFSDTYSNQQPVPTMAPSLTGPHKSVASGIHITSNGGWLCSTLQQLHNYQCCTGEPCSEGCLSWLFVLLALSRYLCAWIPCLQCSYSYYPSLIQSMVLALLLSGRLAISKIAIINQSHCLHLPLTKGNKMPRSAAFSFSCCSRKPACAMTASKGKVNPTSLLHTSLWLNALFYCLLLCARGTMSSCPLCKMAFCPCM